MESARSIVVDRLRQQTIQQRLIGFLSLQHNLLTAWRCVTFYENSTKPYLWYVNDVSCCIWILKLQNIISRCRQNSLKLHTCVRVIYSILPNFLRLNRMYCRLIKIFTCNHLHVIIVASCEDKGLRFAFCVRKFLAVVVQGRRETKYAYDYFTTRI